MACRVDLYDDSPFVYHEGMNKGGFSLSRLLGLAATKARLSRKLGVPLTKGGRDAKLGRLLRAASGDAALLALVLSLLSSSDD